MEGNIFEAKTVDELKKIGKLAEIRMVLKAKAAELGIKVNTGSWILTFESIQKYNELAGNKGKVVPSGSVDAGFNDLYFKSEAAKTIFYLLVMSGEARTDYLGIDERLYEDASAARKWRDRLIKIVHPDNCDHPKAQEAVKEITRIYGRMTKR